jgi:DNA-binding transcriptional ArsR family regulator
MANTKTFAEIAALAGDPVRAAMLHALMDGRALTALELARVAGIAPQTASGHLARLASAGLLLVQKQGRHRYHQLGSRAVAQMIESIMQVACESYSPATNPTTGPSDAALRAARICYDHLAGQLGVALTDAMTGAGYAELSSEGGLLTSKGVCFLNRMGIETGGLLTAAGNPSRRVLCRACLDWSERRMHLGGAIGAAICHHSLARGWIRRSRGTRAVLITPTGRQFFREHFGIECR